MSTLNALSENAIHNAKGFFADTVVNYDIGKKYKDQGCVFCLRKISLPKEPIPNDEEKTELNIRKLEIGSIMSHLGGGLGLYLMPLFEVGDNKSISVFSKSVVNTLLSLEIPINTTIWIDEKSFQGNDDNKGKDTKTIEKNRKACELVIKNACYSVGYYHGGGGDTSEKDLLPKNLSHISCECAEQKNNFNIINIGANIKDCKIRWAYLPSGQ